VRSEIVSQDKDSVSIKVEVDASDFSKAVNESIRRLSQSISIKGFRKGHIPRRVLELYLGKDVIYKDALDRIVPRALSQIVEDYEIELATEPTVNVKEIKEGEPLNLEFTLELRPEAVLPDLKDIEVEINLPQVTDEMVDEAIEELRRLHIQLLPVEGRPSRDGDTVVVDYITTIQDEEGERVLEKAEDVSLNLAHPNLHPQIKEALLSKEVGSHVIAELVVEEGHSDATVAGKSVRCNFEIKKIIEPILPELSEEFIAQVTGGEEKNIEDLREALKAKIARQLENRSRLDARNKALEKLIELSDVDIPTSMIDREAEALKRRDAEAIQQKRGMSLEAYLAEQNLTAEEYERLIRERAQRALKQAFVLDALAKLAGVEVTSGDIDEWITRVASSQGEKIERLRARIERDRELFRNVIDNIRLEKAVDYLMSQVTVKEAREDSASASSPENNVLSEEDNG
jgi:trigger factor